jgi:hypothetical protein
MLVKITTQCGMGCSHCMEDALPSGEHMSMDVFVKSLSFIERVYKDIKIIMISGGEPTEHPQLLDFIKLLDGWYVIVMSNGLFLKNLNTYLTTSLLFSGVTLQIYNDLRYYPIKVDPINHPRVIFGDRINLMSPFGRAKTNNLKSDRQSPVCFNLRSAAGNLKSFSEAVKTLRLSGKMCTPSIDFNGNIIAGESRFCHKIGTVESSEEELLENLLNMECNKCRLEDNLSLILKKCIHTKEVVT